MPEVEVRRELIEMALTLHAVNQESAPENSIRHNYPSTLHLWCVRLPSATRSGREP